jgi:signal transduction histidine kinase
MRVKTKQVAGVTALVGVVVVTLSAIHLASLVRVRLQETRTRAELLANGVFHQAYATVAAADDARAALAADRGVRTTLESGVFSPGVTYAAIADASGVAIAHSDPAAVGRPLPDQADLRALVDQGPWAQFSAIWGDDGRLYEVRTPLLIAGQSFGSIRIGVSMLLMRQEIRDAVRPAALTAAAALAVAALCAFLLAQSLLRPVHLIRSGLSRLGRGEFGVQLDLPARDEFGELGSFFNTLSAQVADDRDRLADHKATAEALRRLTALGRLTSGVAHELKNPLNAMGIHLELIRQAVDASDRDEGTFDAQAAREHLSMIAGSLRRLDDVVQVFLRFTRPEELRLGPVSIRDVFDQIRPIVEAEAKGRRVAVTMEAVVDLPPARGDAAMLEQALLNLALNACQAMPNGGSLALRASAGPGRVVQVRVEDTGIGIPPEHLDKVFNLYFTTRQDGTGIGLAMVYRAVQLHGGEIEVTSSPGGGTTFSLQLPQA